MKSTLLLFDGRYYLYEGNIKGDKVLAIGGYESAFLADLAVYFILENCEDFFWRFYTMVFTEMMAFVPWWG